MISNAHGPTREHVSPRGGVHRVRREEPLGGMPIRRGKKTDIDAHRRQREHRHRDADKRGVEQRGAAAEAANDGAPSVAGEAAAVHHPENDAGQNDEHLSRGDDPEPLVREPAEQ
jgi:hypothetical protein